MAEACVPGEHSSEIPRAVWQPLVSRLNTRGWTGHWPIGDSLWHLGKQKADVTMIREAKEVNV